MNLKPIGDNIVVKMTEVEETTKSGIILTSSAKEKPQIAEVIAVGPGGLIDGKEVKMEVLTGDKVILRQYAGTTVKLESEEYIIVKQSDILAKVVNKHFKAFNISEQLLMIDALVVLTAMITFRDFNIGFYSIIAIFVSAKSIDIVFEGVGFSKAMFIISDAGDEIGKDIMDNVGRGVTGLNGEGMYTKVNKKVLLTVADRRQIPKIKEIAKNHDEKAFIIVTDVREVLGEGFEK